MRAAPPRTQPGTTRRAVQERSILHRHGHDLATKADFLSEIGFTDVEWGAWVRRDAARQARQLSALPPVDTRSPEDIMEDLVGVKRNTFAINEPVYDMSRIMEKWERGPFSAAKALPETLSVRPPAATATNMSGGGVRAGVQCLCISLTCQLACPPCRAWPLVRSEMHHKTSTVTFESELAPAGAPRRGPCC
jgi:hypothetical protein